MALLSPPLPPVLSPARQRAASSPLLTAAASTTAILSLSPRCHRHHGSLFRSGRNGRSLRRRRRGVAVSVEQEDVGSTETTVVPKGEPGPPVSSDADATAPSVEQAEASPEDLECIREIKRVRYF